MANRVDIKVGYSIDKSGLNELQKALDDISVQAKMPGQDMNKGLQEAAKTARQLSNILDRSFNKDLGTINVAKFNQELVKTHLDMATIKKDLENVSQGSTAFNILSSSVLSANAQIKTANKALDQMAVTLKNTIRYGISSSIFNNFANSFQKAYSYAKDLNESLNNIRIVTDASASKMEQFAINANAASKRLGASTLDYTDAALIYYQQGLSDEEARARAEVTLKAANVTGQSAQEVSELLTSVWNGYKVNSEEAELYVDKLAAVAATTAADLEELSTGMSKVASAANLMGVDVDQLNAQLATIVSVTRQAPESVGTALKTIYARMGDIESGMSDETTLGNYTQEMANMGINVLDMNGNLRDMGEVIEEIGNKWTDLSREQQIALSQTMAGTRQYNNLLALFDNWGMYTDAIKTSQEAVGTLQRQQDIYMESTEAHLQSLQATWEDLYDSAIDDSEVNAGIDLLNNLIQTFDNFIDSFGGGIKSIGALGAVLSNVFNKQISGAITNFIQNTTKMQQNIDLLEKKRQAIQLGAAETGITTPGDEAQLANTSTQLKYAQQIREVEMGISQEQYNQLTNLQAQMGQLEQKAVLLEKEAEANTKRVIEEKEYEEYLALGLKDEEKIAEYWQNSINAANEELGIRKELVETLEKNIKTTNIRKAEEKELLTIQEAIDAVIAKSSKETDEELRKLTENIDWNKATLEEKIKILAVAKQIVKEQEDEVETSKKNAEAVENERKNKEEAARLRTQEGQLSVEFENTMDYAKQATTIAERVTMVTSSLSSMVSVWSAINSLFQTWNDENATLGDKITQTFMTLSMTIPTVISAFKSLKGVSDLYNLSKAKTIAMQEVETALRGQELAGLSQEAILQKAVDLVKKQGVAMTEAEVAARLQNIGLLKTETVAHGANTGAKTAETGATVTATAAQNALNASIWAFPGTWIIATLAAVVGAIALVSNAIKEGVKATQEANKATIDAENQKQAEIDKNEELYKSYNSLYEQYTQGKIGKDKLREATEKLRDVYTDEHLRIVGLIDDYETLNNQILEHRRQKALEGKQSAENEQSAAKANLDLTFDQLGTWRYPGRRLVVGEGFDPTDELKVEKVLKDIFGNQMFVNTNENLLTGAGDVLFSSNDAVDFYDKLTQARKEIQAIPDYDESESEVYKGINETINKLEEYVTAYKQATEDVEKYDFELQTLTLDFSTTSLENFVKNREQLIQYIQSTDEYKNKSLESVSAVADSYIQSVNENSKEMLTRVSLLNYLVQKFGEENKDKILTSLKDISDEDLSYVLQVNDKESLQNVEKYFENVKEKINEIHISDALKEELDGLKVSEEQFKEYVETLEELNKVDKEASSDAKEFQEQTKKVALNVIKTNNAVETLSKSFETNRKIIEDNNTSSYDYIKALGDVKEQLETILGVEVSNDFVTTNLEQVQALVDGDVDALDRLRVAAAQDIVQHLNIDLDNPSLNAAYEELNTFINNFDGETIKIDSSLKDTEFVNALNHLLRMSKITAEDATNILNSIGYQPSLGTKTVKKNETHHYVRTNDITGEVERYTETDSYDLEVPVINADKTLYKGSGQNIISYNNNGNKGKGSKGSSGGSGSKAKEPDKKDPIENELDKYHDINIELTQISTELKRLEEQKKKLFGKDLISNINKQLGILQKQIDATRKKMFIATKELNNEDPENLGLRQILAAQGVLFNEDGTIANYEDAYKNQLAYANKKIDDYNKMDAEAQEKAKDTVKNAEDDFKKFTENIDRYDTLITKEIPDLKDDIQKAIDEQITMQIEKFDMEIEIRLDLAEAERDWNEFKKNIIDEVQDDDILGQAIGKLTDFSSYYKEDNTGIVQALTDQVNDTLSELNKMDKLGWSDVYGDNRTAALEDLDKYYTTLMENLTNVEELQKEIHEAYIDMQDEAQEKFDEQIETYEMIGDLIDHDMKVIQLAYGEDSYSTLAQYYNKQQENNNKQLDFQRQQVQFWKEQMNTVEEGSKEWDNAKEKWMDAVKEWNQLVEESIENLQDRYLNAINDIFDRLNDKVTSGLGLDYVNEEWNLINKNAEQYLDNINALYETQALEDKYLDAIDKTDSVGAQRQLKELMDAELKDLRERDRLTQYDVERANKKYEIALKQIALQEAQQNKTKMRLRRDSQGNYRYEYVSDDNQIDQMQDEINNMYNSLYNFDKARYQENLGEIYSAWSEFQEKMAEAAQINDPQERSERELLLQDEYGKLINGLVEQNTQIRLNLQSSAFEDLSRLYDKDIQDYKNMTDTEIDALMNELVPQWESGVQQMADNFAGQGGFLDVCHNAFEELEDATEDYEDSLDELQQVAGQDFDDIQQGIDYTIDETEALLTANDELIGSYEEQMGAIGGVISQLDKLVDKYHETRDAAIEAATAAYNYSSEQKREAADTAEDDASLSQAIARYDESAEAAAQAANDAYNAEKSKTGNSGDGNLAVGERVTFSGKYYYDSYGTSPVGSRYSGVTNGVVVDRITKNPYGIHIHSADGKYMDLGWVKKSQLSGFDTGGYTGTWGNNGRLALLHQKELVLNAHDTENMLNAVTIMRDISNTLGTSVLSRLAGITAAGANGTSNNGLLDQNVHIEAVFPGVTNSREIENALNNLVNMAAMRTNRKGN